MERVVRTTSYELNDTGNETAISFITHQVPKIIYLEFHWTKPYHVKYTFLILTSKLLESEAGRRLTHS